MARYATKSGKVWIRIFPDMPFTQKPAEVKMGKDFFDEYFKKLKEKK
jgi:ribosomal protein L16/L10AE